MQRSQLLNRPDRAGLQGLARMVRLLRTLLVNLGSILEKLKTMKYLWMPIAAAIPFAFSYCEKAESKGDVTFAKTAFESLARGETDVRNEIDWATLKSMGQNVGMAYVKIPSETEKVNFQNAFVTQFSSSFREAGGSPDRFENWRVSFHDDLRTEVAADSSGGTVTITVTERDGKERISELGFIR